MLRNRLLALQHASTAIQLQHCCSTRAKSSNTSGSVARQGKIFGKLFGSRLAGSKKRWYPSSDGNSSSGYQPTTLTFQASQFGKSGSQAPGSKHNTRRMAVLNKLFMTHITDLLATGEAADSILGRGLQVTRVKITSDFNCINVYWFGSGQLQSDTQLDTELQRCSGQLRHELSQLRLMGEVPRIKFVRDKTGRNIDHVEGILRELDFSTGTDEHDEHPFDVAQTVRQEFYGNAVASTTPLQATEATVSTTLALPEMRHDVLGLNHRLIMDKILTKMRRSKQAWDQHHQNQQPAEMVDVQAETENAQIRKLTAAAESASKFDAFLAKRRERKQTPERKKHRNEIGDWPLDAADTSYDEHDLMPDELRQRCAEDDYIDDEEKTHSLK